MLFLHVYQYPNNLKKHIQGNPFIWKKFPNYTPRNSTKKYDFFVDPRYFFCVLTYFGRHLSNLQDSLDKTEFHEHKGVTCLCLSVTVLRKKSLLMHLCFLACSAAKHLTGPTNCRHTSNYQFLAAAVRTHSQQIASLLTR